MLRALSTRARSRRGYERLGEESSLGLLEGNLKRARSVPARLFNPSRKLGGSVPVILEELPRQKSTAKKTSTSKFSHPLFSLFDGLTRSRNSSSSRKKKTTAKPEFSRYLEYLKEGGMWDPRSNMPVIYFK